jgi:integral membrane protein (TIGR00529 family)
MSMDGLLHLPAYIKVGGSFLGILLLNYFGLPLGLAILLFSVLLPLWAGTGMNGLYYQIGSFSQPQNYILPVIILLLLYFTESLSKTGRMERTIKALKEWLKSKHIILAGLPALVGLLPMPAGALFSAPFVASVDEKEELELSHKVAINYWFRHIWEYWWPLYPGVILAMQYSRLPVIVFFLIQIPFTLAAVLGGYIFILRRVKDADDQNRGYGKMDTSEVLSAMGPIGLLVIISLLGSAILPILGIEGTLANLIAMLTGLIIALGSIFSGHAAAFRPSLRMLMRMDTWLMIALVVGIQAFSAALLCPIDAAGATLITGMRDEFIRTGIPLITVIMLIPFISGMVTGVAFGFVGASFPIVFALVGPEPTTALSAATTAFAYSFGYMGMMLSPMHACFVVTAEYFCVPVFGAYRYIIGPVVIILLTSIVLSGIYYIAF